MTIENHPENLKPNGPHDLGQITSEAKSREEIEEMLDALEGANITATVQRLNGLRRGGYRVTVTQSSEWNEVQIRLYENTIREPIASAFVDRGHTRESKFDAAGEVRDMIRIYLCR
jgi:hypothetical protein